MRANEEQPSDDFTVYNDFLRYIIVVYFMNTTFNILELVNSISSNLLKYTVLLLVVNFGLVRLSSKKYHNI